MQLFNSAGRAKPCAAAKHVDEGAVEEAFTAWVEWIMVRMDMFAYDK